MYVLLESSYGNISEASVSTVDGMGVAETEKEAMAWRDENIEYRDYKYVPDKTIKITA